MKRTILAAIAAAVALLILLAAGSSAQATMVPHEYSFKSTSLY